MRYFLQYRDWNGKWKKSSVYRPFTNVDDAWEFARSLDQDGILMPDVRIVDEQGKAVPRPSR